MMISTISQYQKSRIDLLLSGLPLQAMNMLSRLPYSVLRNEKRTISIPLRCLSVHQALLRSCNARISRSTAEHAGCPLRG